MMLMKKWVDVYGLAIKEKASKHISGENSITVQIVGMSSMIVLLEPTIEVDMANVAICLANSYQGLLGCEVLLAYNEALSLATIALPTLDQWATVSWLQRKAA